MHRLILLGQNHLVRGHPTRLLLKTNIRPFFNSNRRPPEPEEFDVNVDYYKQLGLTKNASQQEIKNMYYKLCFENHPDRTGNMHQEKFKAINVAYQVLQNEERRKRYDQAREDLSNGTQGSSQQPNYEQYKQGFEKQWQDFQNSDFQKKAQGMADEFKRKMD
jgi:DnaJ-class molecular chaperone